MLLFLLRIDKGFVFSSKGVFSRNSEYDIQAYMNIFRRLFQDDFYSNDLMYFLHIVNEVLWFTKLKIQSSECTSHKPLREQKK